MNNKHSYLLTLPVKSVRVCLNIVWGFHSPQLFEHTNVRYFSCDDKLNWQRNGSKRKKGKWELVQAYQLVRKMHSRYEKSTPGTLPLSGILGMHA